MAETVTTAQLRLAARSSMQHFLTVMTLSYALAGSFALVVWSNNANSTDSEIHKAIEPLRINHIQNIGTHNSYHAHPLDGTVVDIIRSKYPWFNPEHYQYSFAPLAEQLQNQGVRHFELDIYADHEGGSFNTIPINALAGLPVNRNIAELDKPGFKVLHMPQLDPNSTCLTLVDCLHGIKAWSDARPRHLPILILIEIKDIDLLGVSPYLKTTPFSDADFAAIDTDILSVFPRERIITPDDVQGSHTSLEQAVLNNGWPTLEESRGKVFFMQYHGRPHPDTKGRLLFPQVEPGNPGAAILIVEDFLQDADKVRGWVKQGYLVRARTGRDLQEVKNNDYAVFKAELASGVHFISTDTPVPLPMNPDFVTRIPGGTPARCNPVTAPKECTSEQIENLSNP